MEITKYRPHVHGHRGCRGLLPENTIPAFLKATELGCDYLELDVVMTGDHQVLVSHEPWMHHRICLTPEGDRIAPAHERELNIFRMDLEAVQRYDCGSLQHPDFPGQQNSPERKPLLKEVVETVHSWAAAQGRTVPRFTVEVKSQPSWYGSHQPLPVPYAEAVVRELHELGIAQRCILQSFDPALLNAMYVFDPQVTIALLVDNADTMETNLARLQFTPHIYSPRFTLANEELVRSARSLGLAIAVWTVNREEDMRRMIELGADGIITDHPDRLIALLGR